VYGSPSICYGGAEYVGISAAPHPVFVGENYDMVLAQLPFLRQKVAPQREWVSQHAIQRRNVEATFDVFGLVMSGHVEVTAHPSMHVLECGGLRFQSAKSPAETSLRSPPIFDHTMTNCSGFS
jgi:hypothetical protein